MSGFKSGDKVRLNDTPLAWRGIAATIKMLQEVKAEVE